MTKCYSSHQRDNKIVNNRYKIFCVENKAKDKILTNNNTQIYYNTKKNLQHRY